MRLMHVLKHSVRNNGSVHVAVDLACAQAARGHEVWFVSARGAYDELLRAHGVHVHPVTEALSGLSALRSLVDQLRLARQVKPHVIHAHMMSSAVLGAVVATLTSSVLVATVHNSFDRHSWLMRVGKRVVAVSEAERQLLLQRGFGRRKVVTVLNGTAGSARLGLPFDGVGPLRHPSVMTLCGLHPRKGVDRVIDGFALVAAEFPDWHLNVVGWGAERQNLEAQADRLGVSASVHFLGSTITPMPLLEGSEIFAHGALVDPCPLTVMEARVAGCAIIGTDVGGITEVLEYGVAGHVVPPGDHEAFARAFRHLMGDASALVEWRARAKRGSEYFSVERVAEEYDVVYASVRRRCTRLRASIRSDAR